MITDTKSHLLLILGLVGGLLPGFSPSPSLAQAIPGVQVRSERPTLTVTGRGEVSVAPDLAIIRLGAIAENADAAKAQAQVNETMQRALRALRELKIPENKIKTVGLGLSPVYEQREPSPRPTRPQIVGYRARNTLQIEVEDLSSIGKLVDAAVGAGANQIESLSFTLKNDLGAKQQALRAAADEASVKSRALAEATGVEITAVREVIEGGVQILQPRTDMAMARMSFGVEQATPVQPGEVQIEASITIRYDIINRNR